MSESYYVLEKFSECERVIKEQIEVMPIKRRAVDIFKEKNNIGKGKIRGHYKAARTSFRRSRYAGGKSFLHKAV